MSIYIEQNTHDLTELAAEFLLKVRQGNEHLVKVMLHENPKLLNCKDMFGTNALHYALSGKHFNLAKFFIENGIDTTAKNKLGEDAKSIIENLSIDASTRAELNTMLLNKDIEQYKKQIERIRKYSDNPFANHNLPFFLCNAFHDDEAKVLPSLKGCLVFNEQDVLTFSGSISINITFTKESTGNITNPSTHTKTQLFAQTVLIDLLPKPTFETDVVTGRSMWRKKLLSDEVFVNRMNIIRMHGIIYFADYDVAKILDEITIWHREYNV